MDIYDKLGASATKGEVLSAIKNESKGLYPNAFCKIMQDPFDKDYAMLIHADGAGTKSLIAYLHYKENKDASAFKNPAQDSVVMNVDDMACVGAVDNLVISNTIDRNAHRISGAAIEQIILGYSEFIKNLNKLGINLISGGGETADVGDIVTTCTINSTFFTRLKKSKLITFEKVKAGNVIVGLSSFGKASYEDKENSGIGSNGLTAARHLLLKGAYAKKYPEIQSETIKGEGYIGKYSINDKLPNSNMTIGEALMSPTRTYLPIIKELVDNNFQIINGIVHNTGGALTKSSKHGDNLHYIKDNLFAPPAIFKAIYERGAISLKEMFKVFNMGQRMEIYVAKENAQTVINAANKYGVEAKIIGRIEKHDGRGYKVSVCYEGQTYEYFHEKEQA
jgi:phosphoribosylformylglycinamidine cyclo-ligase